MPSYGANIDDAGDGANKVLKSPAEGGPTAEGGPNIDVDADGENIDADGGDIDEGNRVDKDIGDCENSVGGESIEVEIFDFVLPLPALLSLPLFPPLPLLPLLPLPMPPTLPPLPSLPPLPLSSIGVADKSPDATVTPDVGDFADDDIADLEDALDNTSGVGAVVCGADDVLCGDDDDFCVFVDPAADLLPPAAPPLSSPLLASCAIALLISCCVFEREGDSDGGSGDDRPP
jgi:hypothetical protein